ncbi:MAG: hypothetical protein U5K99_04815 [Anaerolineales bacterium]|nr:hypothetical protein [Anaerolineales bacterium]
MKIAPDFFGAGAQLAGKLFSIQLSSGSCKQADFLGRRGFNQAAGDNIFHKESL